MVHDTAPALFGVEGLQVTGVQAGPDGGIEARAVTNWQAARACPECGTVSDRGHETVLTRLRDVRRACWDSRPRCTTSIAPVPGQAA